MRLSVTVTILLYNINYCPLTITFMLNDIIYHKVTKEHKEEVIKRCYSLPPCLRGNILCAPF